MKKITLTSFVFIALLVTGLSALIVDSNSENITTQTEEKNSDKAKNDFEQAEEALSELEAAADSDGSNSSVCQAYVKVQRYCKRITEYDDDSSDKDDDSSDDESDDNVSDYQSSVQNLLNKADEAMERARVRTRERARNGYGKEISCERELECEKVQNRFMYQLHGDDNSNQLRHRAGCHDDGSSDDESSDDKEND